MMPPVFSPKPDTPLTLDSSVVINFNACGHGRTVLSAFRNPIVVIDFVEAEIGRGNRQKRQDKLALDALVADGIITIASLDEVAMQTFESLVIGPAITTLDDGEAATIAYAVHAGSVAVVDGRKATALSQRRFPELVTMSTMDLFASASVRSHLGHDLLKEAIFMALVHGRMQVPKIHLDWVLGLIGQEKAIQCLSLPSFARVTASSDQDPEQRLTESGL
jgi:predicted nucleic acid-binding protein